MPLAIELAAARVRTLGVDQILERLDDSVHLLVGGSRTASGRQQTLLATLNWSYGLLTERESIVFRQLGVFTGSWSLSAAEAVCANDRVAQRNVLNSLQRLVDKSLVVVDQRERQARYRLLEPVRQYANGQLIASGESDGARRRHALHYAEFAEARARDTNTGGSRRFEATAELAGEYPNMRLAFAYLVENGESQLGLRLAFNLLFLWQVQEALSEPRTWLSRLLALPGADEPTEARAGGLVTAARIAEMAGDITAAQAFCAEALPLARGLGVPLLEFLALIFSANNARAVGDTLTAESCAHDALACARAAGDSIGEGMILQMLAAIACDRADYMAAQPLLREALHMARANGDAWAEAWTLLAAGRAELGLGALDEARVVLNTALAMARQQGEPAIFTSRVFDAMGELEMGAGHQLQAQAWLVRSLDMRYEWGEPVWMAQTFQRLAALAACSGQAERALRLAGAGDRLYASFGTRRSPAEQQNLERWLAPLRETLGEQIVDARWAEGSALELGQAIALGRDDGGSAAPEVRVTPRGDAASVLTAREREVATCLARGESNRQIAAQLVITERTVASHIEHILEKLGFASRHQVSAWMVEHERALLTS